LAVFIEKQFLGAILAKFSKSRLREHSPLLTFSLSPLPRSREIPLTSGFNHTDKFFTHPFKKFV